MQNSGGGQNPERSKSRMGQNPEGSKSRMGQNPDTSKSRIGRKCTGVDLFAFLWLVKRLHCLKKPAVFTAEGSSLATIMKQHVLHFVYLQDLAPFANDK
ncbi:hypothetical protein M514_10869 [Trichuris suis]|uniref:Uncharacterized protein n=1 Tax=Trichuris suis TaxID=68888 RepID=A0A085LTJ6_9BILA|nr:hypothetical protein M513_10869 [Trichuris suis]KFD63252.1 hypothetical protein M514_10869 [Trichuris suis]